MKPKTVLQWHEHAFLQWWRWKSRRKGGRPTISQEMQVLIRRLSRENVLWSAETIHGHLVLLGFDPPCPDTIRKYTVSNHGNTGIRDLRGLGAPTPHSCPRGHMVNQETRGARSTLCLTRLWILTLEPKRQKNRVYQGVSGVIYG